MRPRRVSALLAFFTVVSSLALAQEQSGGLQGRVVDSTRGALPGVTVTVTGPTIIGNSLTTVTGEKRPQHVHRRVRSGDVVSVPALPR